MLTINVAAYDPALLSIEETRVAAGLTSADAAQDGTLDPLRLRISAAIASACNVARAGISVPTLREEEVTETFRFKSTQDALYLARKPVVSITSLTESSAALGDSEYEIDGNAVYRLSGSERTCWGCGTVVVAYIAGWEVVPDDLKLAAVKFIQAERAQGSRDPLLKRVNIVGVSEREYWVDPTKDSVVPAEVMDLLISGGYADRWPWMR